MPIGKHLDWSIDQFCSFCGNQMRRQKKDLHLNLVAHEKNGLCRRCANKKGSKVIFNKNGQVCNSCKEYKLYKNFTKSKDCKSGHNSTCKQCKVLWIHNISKKTFDKILTAQKQRCAICDRSFEEFKGSWHIDHDHKCCGDRGKKSCGNCIRGILCGSCNNGLGMMQDNTKILKNAVIYLENNSKHI